ncbi:MAG: ribosomal protein S18-alanine N-acetyltransferase [Hyphomicrobium aestuarii]|nr:ribosomal protein S18-alanine N-acetyltransferase [Hyphomicrobium aestuarii]
MDVIDPQLTDLEPISLLWASPERSGEVAAIHAELFNPPWSEEAIRKLLEHPAAAALIAVAGMRREPAGFVLAQLAGDEAEILSVGVAPRFQRRGVGKKLIDGLIRAAAKAEARRLFLEVGVDNKAALRLYEKLDFKRVGIRPKYYQRRGEPPVDALVLALEF